MPKLKLDVEALEVETFATVAESGRRGTVRGAAYDVFAAVRETPGDDTGCTAPCMSGESLCEMVSCGSSCEEASCYIACDARLGWG